MEHPPRNESVRSSEHIESLDASKRKKIEQFLAEVLPPSEERIPEKMDQDCKVAVVIPAYGERQNILQTLLPLAEQQDVRPTEYEVLVVVNNPGSEPERLEDDTDQSYQRKIQHYRQALTENQETLRLLQSLRENKAVDGLQKNEQALFDAIKASGIRVFGIDKSSADKTLPKVIANVGGARNRGLAEACERFYRQLNRNGIVAHTDADTKVDRFFIRNLIDTFEHDPSLLGMTGALQFETTELDEEQILVNWYSEIESQYNLLINKFLHVDQPSREAIQPQVYFMGANMASRAFEAILAGGIPTTPRSEDGLFGENLSRLGKIEEAPQIKVTTQFRSSSRASGGFGIARLKWLDRIRSGRPLEVRTVENQGEMDRIVGQLQALIEQQQVTAEAIRQILTVDGNPLLNEPELADFTETIAHAGSLQEVETTPKYAKLFSLINARFDEIRPLSALDQELPRLIQRACQHASVKSIYESEKIKCTEEENRTVQARLDVLTNIISRLIVGKPSEHLTMDSFIALLEERKTELGISHEDIEDLQKNPERTNALLAQITSSSDVATAVQKITEISKNEFTRVEENPILRQVIELRAINAALEKAF